MTTYIPSLTLPDVVFNNLSGSVLLPIALGSAVGYSTKRTFLYCFFSDAAQRSLA